MKVAIVSKMSYQHSRSQVELVEELGDEDVHLQHLGDVFLLHVSQHVDEPLETLVGWADPQEVYLTTSKRDLDCNHGFCMPAIVP